MHRLHLTRNLRTVAFLLILTAAIAAPVGLWWLNRSGLPDSWRAAIESEIAKQGAHISIGTLSYNPFRGISATSFDGRGNYSLGIREQIIFPEIDYDRIDQVRGMDITITTTAATDDEARELLKHFGMPFREA